MSKIPLWREEEHFFHWLLSMCYIVLGTYHFLLTMKISHITETTVSILCSIATSEYPKMVNEVYVHYTRYLKIPGCLNPRLPNQLTYSFFSLLGIHTLNTQSWHHSQ